ncbi:MAG: guanylate kinase [Candidatus Ruminococcus intestinipullorum]|nr:guanylate kinase [Candidatus Ruminococcus intestinipullorum]
MNKIFYIMGKSSSGKDTMYKKILEEIPELKTVTLYTTRPIREGENDGVEYFFVEEEKFQEFQEMDKIIEARSYDTIYGVWTYFTADDGQMDLNKYHYLIMGTLESYQEMKRYFGEERVEPIYIEVEDGVRLERALKRERMQKEPKYNELCRRFLADSEDFSEVNLEKVGIQRRFQNIDFQTCLNEVIEFIKEKMCVILDS